MKPSLLKKLTAGFDPLAWLAVADHLEDAGEDSHPWRMRGLVGRAVQPWFKSVWETGMAPGAIYLLDGYYLYQLAQNPTFYSFLLNIGAYTLGRFAVWRKTPCSPERVRAFVFRVTDRILLDRETQQHPHLRRAASAAAKASALLLEAGQSPGPSASPLNRPHGMLALRSRET